LLKLQLFYYRFPTGTRYLSMLPVIGIAAPVFLVKMSIIVHIIVITFIFKLVVNVANGLVAEQILCCSLVVELVFGSLSFSIRFRGTVPGTGTGNG
jgi:hypothetical protein